MARRFSLQLSVLSIQTTCAKFIASHAALNRLTGITVAPTGDLATPDCRGARRPPKHPKGAAWFIIQE